MKIVILDGYTTNPGDLSWECLKEFGDLTLYERSTPDQIPRRIKDADIVLVNDYELDADTLSFSGHLSYIGVISTGYNGIDITDHRDQRPFLQHPGSCPAHHSPPSGSNKPCGHI